MAPPVARSIAELPLQIVAEGVTLIVGRAFTVTVTLAVFWQPAAFVPVTTKVLVAEGVATTVAPVDAESEPAGDHE